MTLARRGGQSLALIWTKHARERMAERYGSCDHTALAKVETAAARGFDDLRPNDRNRPGTVRVCVQMLDGPLWLVLEPRELVVITVFGHIAEKRTA